MVRWLWSKVPRHLQIEGIAKRVDAFFQTQNKRIIGYSVAATALSTTIALILHAIEKAIEIITWLVKLF